MSNECVRKAYLIIHSLTYIVTQTIFMSLTFKTVYGIREIHKLSEFNKFYHQQNIIIRYNEK